MEPRKSALFCTRTDRAKTARSTRPSDSCFRNVNVTRRRTFPDEFFCASHFFGPYDASMKLIGRKTVKGGKVSAPMVKAASTVSKSKGAAASGHDPSHDDIAARAYELYLARGSVDGYSEEDWLLAEAELRRR
jgi:Protein of unknown function (DUF2934)